MALHRRKPADADLELIDLAATAKRLGGLTQFLAALQSSGLLAALRDDSGPFTVFAPTDAALDRLPAGLLQELRLPAHQARLLAVLRHHLVAGQLRARHFIGKSLSVTTLQGDDILLDGRHGLRADQAHVQRSDLLASNGVLHAIDGLLMPVGP
jgi:uncharacterized surface protein with fasciclin (FAS1) repeats